MNDYERMYHAFGNEEIFWEWFWELMLAHFDENIEHLFDESPCPPHLILWISFTWGLTSAGHDFWYSLAEAMRKEEALCLQ